MSRIREFIEALRNGNGYDWICNYGYTLDKDDLIRIIKEYDYGIHANADYEIERKCFYSSIADELEEWYSEED